MSTIQPDVMQQFVHKLRNEYRIKDGTDFAMTYKYGELHLLSGEVYRDIIVEAATEFGIVFKTTHVY